jgi:hypothetical protein
MSWSVHRDRPAAPVPLLPPLRLSAAPLRVPRLGDLAAMKKHLPKTVAEWYALGVVAAALLSVLRHINLI